MKHSWRDWTGRCKTCGKTIHKNYDQCLTCSQRAAEFESYLAWHNKSEEEKELERERYYDTLCVMCGKEGASERSDGKDYCSTCWTIWNS